MRDMWNVIRELQAEGQPVVLVTVTATSGATPRGAGARMLVGREGRLWGTIGGGAVEYRSQQLARQVLERRESGQHQFTLTREDVEDLGMICGGNVEVFFHYIPQRAPEVVALAEEALARMERGQALWLISNISQGGDLSLYTKNRQVIGKPVPQWVLERLSRKPKVVEQDGQRYCVEQINDAGRVLIFGCGHVSQELEPVLSHVGFRCVVMDDRPEFARRELFPTAEAVKLVDFSNIAASVDIGPEDYVCVMTRGHAFDTVIQAQVLKCHPCYVGVIGSRKKAAGVHQALKTGYGLTEEELSQVITPIGLEIGAETPAEIAVSVAAQMIQHRARLLSQEEGVSTEKLP